MPKQKLKQLRLPLATTTRSVAVLVIAAVFLIGSLSVPGIVNADQYDQKIRALQEQNAEVQGQVSNLEEQAASYEEAIARLRAEISAIEGMIRDNERKQAEIQNQIDQLQTELERQRAVLGENIKAMYVGGEMSTIEMLATSKDLSEFVDKEAYRSAVQRQIQETMLKIAELQNELGDKQAQVETLLREQRAQRATLDANRAEQARLLAMNQAQQDEYSSRLKANNKKIADLRAQQAIENARLFGGGGGQLGGGGYPWGYAKCLHTGQVGGYCYNYDWSVNGSIWNWSTGGYGFRNCTDWVSWRIRSQGGHVPSGLGNAKTWDDRAPGYGFSVSTTPQAGDAAVSNSGNYGHVMYVETVQGNGSILVSDYNRAGTGKYSTAVLERVGTGIYRNPNNGVNSYLNFVHF